MPQQLPQQALPASSSCRAKAICGATRGSSGWFTLRSEPVQMNASKSSMVVPAGSAKPGSAMYTTSVLAFGASFARKARNRSCGWPTSERSKFSRLALG